VDPVEENIRYLTGFAGEGSLFVSAEKSVLLTDFRYIEQAARESPRFFGGPHRGDLKTEDALKALIDEVGLEARRHRAQPGHAGSVR
jgi:Xaa-Pro aminopeptidase